MDSDESQVLGVVIVVREGDRQYLPQLWWYQPLSVQGGSPITSLGENQQFQLGALLRSIYLNVTSPSFVEGVFGETPLYNQSEVTIRADSSVAGGATFASAVALSQGLWPPSPQDAIQIANGTNIVSPLGGYQYVLIEPVDPAQDFTLTGGVMSCNAWWDRIYQFQQSSAFTEQSSKSTQLLEESEQLFPGSAQSLENFGTVYDYLNVQSIHNRSFVDNVSPDLLPQARALNDWLAYNMFTDPEIDGIGNIVGRSIMGDIMQALYAIADTDNTVKMYIDVVSFEPFLSLMNITGIAEGGNLPANTVEYAAAMTFELRNTSSGDLVVRANFKNGSADDAFHTYPMIFGDWNGSGGKDVPLPTLTETFTSVSVHSDDWYTWCTVCQNNSSSICLLTNLTHQALLNSTQGVPASATSSPSADGPGTAAGTLAHGTFSSVGAGFLGAGLAAIVLSAVFGFLLFLGVFSYGGVRKWRRFSHTSYRRDKRRTGDELELRSEANSVVGLKIP